MLGTEEVQVGSQHGLLCSGSAARPLRLLMQSMYLQLTPVSEFAGHKSLMFHDLGNRRATQIP